MLKSSRPVARAKQARKSAPAVPEGQSQDPRASVAARLGARYDSTAGHALLSAALFWAALPPLDWWPLAWIAPVWWIILVRRPELSGKRPYAEIWLAGFLFWLGAVHWLRLPHWATSFGWVALSFYLAFYLPAFIGLARVAVHRLRIPVVIAAPVVWVGMELLQAHMLTGFSMGSLAHTQYRWLALIQISDLAGFYAVSFLLVLAAACVARMVPLEENRRIALWPLVPLAVGVAATLAYGHMRMLPERPPAQARIALIQGSIDSELKADPARQYAVQEHYTDLTSQAVNRFRELDLIVWPETMFRGTLLERDATVAIPDDWGDSPEEFEPALDAAIARSRDALAAMAARYQTPMVLGVDTVRMGADRMRRFNSAVHVSADGRVLARYDKMHLVTFGEYIPFADRFAWLQTLTPLPVSLDRGQLPAAFEVNSLRLAPNICFESVLSHVIRRQITRLAGVGIEPDVLVNLTNDGWFWGSSELDMHLACGVFRAVECRKPFVIAANTGISAWIDGNGKILARGPRRATGVLLAEVGRDPRQSPYLAYGDLPAGLCLLSCLPLAAIGLHGRWRQRKAGLGNAL
ncbi:MAG: apolipoprotein N-acyltransferase [Thermoguttaceae bacterium]|nr:apolipoprotein N-acyltransferase [Thermoguttaceae bacterium]